MHTHNSTNISSKIPPASRHGQVFNWVETICVDHEIPIVLVDGGSLTAIPVVEEFWEGLPFDIVDLAHVEPGTVTWENDRVGL